jgi:hypothetical protein
MSQTSQWYFDSSALQERVFHTNYTVESGPVQLILLKIYYFRNQSAKRAKTVLNYKHLWVKYLKNTKD